MNAEPIRPAKPDNLEALPVPRSAGDTRMLLEAFLSVRSECTLRAYRQDLEDFTAFMQMPEAVMALQQLIAESPGRANALALAYKADLMNRNLKAATVNRRLSALRSVVKLAKTLGYITWTLEVQGLRSEPYRNTKGPGREGFRTLLAKAREQNPAKAARDVAILRLLYDLALRRGEVAHLDVQDADLENGTLAVLGKGCTEPHLLTLPEPTTEALRSWIEVRGDQPGPPFKEAAPDTPLFTNFDRAGKGQRLTGRSIHRLIKRLGQRAGLEAWPHGLRHSAITDALDLTGDVRKVQRFSRHRDLQTLTLYDDNRLDLGGEVAKLVAGAAREMSP